ncbi:MAG: GNAT family N-acetyltransferase [Candidatus Lokiarchaeota archaeon]|nr:GNAT family N-acetyltransferase [Candidatus Lokiarchaeota archaeon]
MKGNNHKILPFNNFNIKEISKDNILNIHQLFEKNSRFFSLPFDYFQRGTLEDDGLDRNLSLILYDQKEDRPIAAVLVVRRKEIDEKYCFFKGYVVSAQYRRQGLGSKMFSELVKRLREDGITQIIYGPSVPNYWQPGVDIRDTSLYFFLKRHGFKSSRAIYNLTVPLNTINKEPAKEKDGYIFERVLPNDFNKTIEFIKKLFPNNTWADEVKFSLKLQPPTTFIAKNETMEIVGWATHSQFFPGSFGPTGVEPSIRGKGIGTKLFLWCLWDIKQKGLDTCEIMWVEGDTIKFYSKATGAYISPIYYPMYKKIKY